MIELVSTFMVLHALSLILLSMPKYNKAIKGFPKRDKKLEKGFKFIGLTLLFFSFCVMVFVNGIGVGIAWFCALITLMGTLLSVLYSLNASYTGQIVMYLPQIVFGQITVNCALLYLGAYSCITLSLTL